MSNNSFTSFLNSNSNNSSNGSTAKLNKASDRQIKYYTDLCERKRVTRKTLVNTHSIN